MNKEKKIELQSKIIDSLRNENRELKNRVSELEKKVADDKNTVDAATVYIDKQKEAMASLIEAKEKYVQARREMIEQKNKYKAEMDKLLNVVKKKVGNYGLSVGQAECK